MNYNLLIVAAVDGGVSMQMFSFDTVEEADAVVEGIGRGPAHTVEGSTSVDVYKCYDSAS